MTLTTTDVLLALGLVAILCGLVAAALAVYDLWQAALGRRRDHEGN